jgi:hypothetical protein
MSGKHVWYGGPTGNTWNSRQWSFRGKAMTAISMMYTDNRFLIAADGRCRSDDESATEKDRETDHAQKIFLVESGHLKMAYALTGFSSNEGGIFDMVAEAEKQVKTLAMSSFSNGNQYISRFCQNIKRVVAKAKYDGRITEFSKREPAEPEEKGRKFKFYFLGFFGTTPFWVEAKFYHHPEQCGDFEFELRKNDFEIAPQIRSVGSETIANMMYAPNAPEFSDS